METSGSGAFLVTALRATTAFGRAATVFGRDAAVFGRATGRTLGTGFEGAFRATFFTGVFAIGFFAISLPSPRVLDF